MFSIKKWIIQQRLSLFKIPRDLVRYSFNKNFNTIAAITDFGQITYKELSNKIYSLATGLSAIGIKKNDTIFVMVSDGINYIEIVLACYETGIIFTPININSSTERMLLIANQLNPKLFIYDPVIAQEIAVLLKKNLPDLQLLPIGKAYQDLMANNSPQKSKTKIYKDDITALGFTSGTTGVPKILPFTHGSYITSLLLLIKNIDIVKKKNPDVFLIGIPLTGGGNGPVLPCIASGATMILPKTFDAGIFLELIQKHKVTRIFTTPSLLIDLLDHPEVDNYNLSTLDNIIYGTETLAASKLIEAIKRFGPILQQGYGSSEVLPPVSMLQPKDHLEGTEIASFNVLTSAGKIIPEVTVKITDEMYQSLPYGQIGRILVKSPTLFKGYWEQPELNEKIFIDGFLDIGDVGRLESDRRLHVLGRLADVIHVNNRIIYPRHVEEMVHNHPAVKECSLVQVDNEAILAVSLRQRYRTNPDYKLLEKEILAILKNTVESYQIPNSIEFFEDLPRSFLVKVLRREVRELLKAKKTPTVL